MEFEVSYSSGRTPENAKIQINTIEELLEFVKSSTAGIANSEVIIIYDGRQGQETWELEIYDTWRE